MIALEQTDRGVVVPVRAHAKARRNSITALHAGRLKIAVTEAPEKGKANAAIAELLAEALGVRPSQVELLSGAASTDKRFLVAGLTAARAREALAAQFERDDGTSGRKQ